MDNEHRIVRASNKTPEEKAREAQVRADYQKRKPKLSEMIRDGDAEFVMTQGEYFDLMLTMDRLKKLRESAGLSLAQLSEKTGIDKAAISRLESGVAANPTINTLQSLAHGLGKQVCIQLVDLGK